MWQTNTILSNGVRIHYTRGDSAQGKPALLFLHGFSDDGQCWLPIASQFVDTHDVIMLDARGHGRSEAPPRNFGNYYQAIDALGLIHGLGLKKPLLLGHSMGAATSLSLAGLFPHTPAAIILEDPPPWWMPDNAGDSPERRAGMVQWITGAKRRTLEELVAGNKADSPTWPEAERIPWATSKLRFSMNVLSDFRELGVNIADVAKNISCPALLIYSDSARGGIVSPAQAEALNAILPQLQTRHIGGAGHNIRREQPAAFVEAVKAFIKQLA